jgi:hypothetical protein
VGTCYNGDLHIRGSIAKGLNHERGLHYIVGGITEELEKLRSFDINTVIQTMSAGAPCLWELISSLLVADEDLKSRREKRRDQ